MYVPDQRIPIKPRIIRNNAKNPNCSIIRAKAKSLLAAITLLSMESFTLMMPGPMRPPLFIASDTKLMI